MLPDHLFTADYSVGKLINVLLNLHSDDGGKLIAYDGSVIDPI